MIKKLICFDFDGTLINSPQPIEGKKIWKEKKGIDWNYNGWWSRPESLDIQVFCPTTNQWVLEKFQEASKKEDTLLILATGRIQKLYPNVIEVLKFNGITIRTQKGQFGFDSVFCNYGEDTFKFKCKLFEDLISNHPHLDEFTMFDDREEHLLKFVEWASSQKIRVNIIDVLRKAKIFPGNFV